VSEERRKDDQELRRLRSEVAAQERDIHDRDDLEHRQDALIARLRDEVAVREEDLVLLGERLETAEHELEDLPAIRDALTPPELPRRRADLDPPPIPRDDRALSSRPRQRPARSARVTLTRTVITGNSPRQKRDADTALERECGRRRRDGAGLLARGE
jgi:hypothetical protein